MSLYDDVLSIGSKSHLGVKRWDVVLDDIEESGSCCLPVKIGGKVFDKPFYYVYEKLNDQEAMHIRFEDGSEPFRSDDVYGFYGLSKFVDYSFGQPIFLVEGITDWLAVKSIYPFVLATLTAGISPYQYFMLKHLTGDVILGFDKDIAGNAAFNRVVKKYRKLEFTFLMPTMKDYGIMMESEFGMEMLKQAGGRLKIIIDRWNKKCITHK